MKSCNRCLIPKPETEYYWQSNGDGDRYRDGTCKHCRNTAQKAVRASNRRNHMGSGVSELAARFAALPRYLP